MTRIFRIIVRVSGLDKAAAKAEGIVGKLWKSIGNQGVTHLAAYASSDGLHPGHGKIACGGQRGTEPALGGRLPAGGKGTTQVAKV